MPAMPMKLAALRYSPEMAEAFQPTLTQRPATKKSLAVLEFFARPEAHPDRHDDGDGAEGEDVGVDGGEDGSMGLNTKHQTPNTKEIPNSKYQLAHLTTAN